MFNEYILEDFPLLVYIAGVIQVCRKFYVNFATYQQLHPTIFQEWSCIQYITPQCNQEYFRAEEVFWNKGNTITISSTTHAKKIPYGKILEFFFLDTLKNMILNEKFNPQMKTIRTSFFGELRHFFNFQKRQERLLTANCRPVFI